MPFEYDQKVLFKYCDPAGIVFFPRYAEMLNDAVETFFAEILDWPFEQMHTNVGVPTAALSMQFKAPSHHGDQLKLRITVQKIGRASLQLATQAVCQEETRFVADQTLVCIDAEGKPQSWPVRVRENIENILETQK